MNKSLLFKILVTVIAFVSITGGAYAQVTTSTLTGTIKDSMESLPGATIKAIHTPTGTSYGAITNKDGRFTISNMRVGGPYTIQVSFLGYQTEKVEGVYLKLGETFSVNVKLNESGANLNDVVIKGVKGKTVQEKTGASTNISSRDLTTLPTISRSITDFTRLTPQANGNNFGGRDARYNNIQVDGANLNNNFGLSNDPLPGGGLSANIIRCL